jgi:hypothetical protein
MNELETKGLGGKSHTGNNGTIDLTLERLAWNWGYRGALQSIGVCFFINGKGRFLFSGGGSFQGQHGTFMEWYNRSSAII